MTEEIDFIAYSFQLEKLQPTTAKREALVEDTCYISSALAENIKEQSTVPADRIIMTHPYNFGRVYGSFFGCIYRGKLRIHLVFSDDVDVYNGELLCLIYETAKQAGLMEGKLWISNQNSKIAAFMQNELHTVRDKEEFLYESHEMVMTREKYNAMEKCDGVLDIRHYEDEHLDRYLLLLYQAMTFKIPPHNYLMKKEYYRQVMQEFSEHGLFEAFWKENELVGLYWIADTEIDHLAVAPKYQHKGYSKQILMRAIEKSLENPEVDRAWLLVVEWNSKAYRFYRKFGMEEIAAYHVPYRDTV